MGSRLCLLGGGGSGEAPTKGGLFKLDFPSAKFWVKIFFGWVGGIAKRPPLFPFKQSLVGRGKKVDRPVSGEGPLRPHPIPNASA